MTWTINGFAIPNILEDDWHLGYRDYMDSKPLLHPHNSDYLAGWKNAWGTLDGYSRVRAIFTDDRDYMSGYLAGQSLSKFLSPPPDD